MALEIVVPANIIVALTHFAGDKDVRYYLNGIHFEIHHEACYIVATNGVVMGAFHHKWEPKVESESLPIRATVPIELFDKVRVAGEARIQFGAVETTEVPGGANIYRQHTRPVAVFYKNSQQVGRTIDGAYPDWRRMFPRAEVSCVPAQFDAMLIAAMAKAYKALRGAKKFADIGIAHNGTAPAILEFGIENFTGLIMPLKPAGVKVTYTTPLWVDISAADDQAEGLI
jgi:hypothetical protein